MENGHFFEYKTGSEADFAALREQIYAGFLGMNIGIRLGAPVEPNFWTSQNILHYYGEIKKYVKDFHMFAADDDANGPYYFLRAMYDKAAEKLTPQDVAEAWLNYAREGVGMFWWGGYGVSTEHTAYLNLKNGIPAPLSGSAQTNGLTMAEQIGGQIFIDTWGLIFPGDPAKAAEYAEIAASVSHDKNGLYGAAFIAACIAQAFVTRDVDELIDTGLSFVPADSTYAAVVRAVREFYSQNPDDWRSCLDYLQQNWGYDRYAGNCHIIPNAGVCVMGLLYGRNLARAVEICTMSGWDTDCNAGNVGTIMGVAGGLTDIPQHYREPINDVIILSGMTGCLNMLDLPSYAAELARMSFALNGLSLPQSVPDLSFSNDIWYDFEIPGSTHGLCLSNKINFSLVNSDDMAYSGKRSVRVMLDETQRGKSTQVYFKPFYRRADFDDTRYMPVFSPKIYPGQRVSMMINADRMTGEDILVTPYVRNTFTKKNAVIAVGADQDGNPVYGISLKQPGWRELSFIVPDLDGAMADEIGVIIESNSSVKNQDFAAVYIDDIRVTGKAAFSISFAKQAKEFDSITPFAHNHGAWEIVDGRMEAMCLNDCEAVSGLYFMRDVEVKGSLKALTGTSHLISLRVQGAQRGYYAGLCENGVAIYLKQQGKMQQLTSVPFEWIHGQTYAVEFRAECSHLTFSINGELIASADSDVLQYGMAGYAMNALGRSSFGDMFIREL